jgi:antitoxin component YwqK of YwqJK toxin-antitoxin module
MKILNILNMRWILIAALLFSTEAYAQLKDYKLNANGDTLNRVDMNGMKQGIWVNRFETLRGEPGYEEEGIYKNDRKEGEWKLFSLMGDLVGIENYRWGLKDGICQYFTVHGELRLEQRWIALNPDKQYDTLVVEDIDKLDSYNTVIVKNEGASLKHGTWKYYDPVSGMIVRTETYTLGKQEKDQQEPLVTAPSEKKKVEKPKEVLEFEKKNSGKKKVKYKDGSTGGY